MWCAGMECERYLVDWIANGSPRYVTNTTASPARRVRCSIKQAAHQHARRLWQTEHTAGGIQKGKKERGSLGGNHLKGRMLVVPNVRGF
jgi:hypothetical protein